MGKAALIAIASFAAMSTFYSTSSKTGMLKASERVANHQYETLARSAAVNGFNLAKQALTESFASRSYEGTFDRAVYGVEIRVSGDRAVVESVGSIPNASGDESEYTVRAEFQRRTLAAQMAEEVPEFMSYALITDEDLRVSGNAGSATVYTSNEDLNANFHTNEDLRVDGKGNKTIQGRGTYAGSASGKHLDSKFQPNGGGAPTDGADAVTISDFEDEKYAAFATVTSGSTTLSGVVEGGERTEPEVWLVNGDLDVRDVTIDGYVMFLVTGDIDISGNVRVGSSGYTEKDESSVAFYSGENIDIRGNAEVWAQLYAAEDFDIGGNAELYGSVATLGKADIQGDPTFYYREASPALTTIWNGIPGGPQIRMTSFFEK